jgi:hypothetical protein
MAGLPGLSFRQQDGTTAKVQHGARTAFAPATCSHSAPETARWPSSIQMQVWAERFAGSSDAVDATAPLDETGAHAEQRTRRARGSLGGTPASADVPCRIVECTRSFGVQRPSDCHHVPHIVAVSETRPQEHPPKMDVVGDIATGHVTDGNAEVPFEDLPSLPSSVRCRESRRTETEAALPSVPPPISQRCRRRMSR